MGGQISRAAFEGLAKFQHPVHLMRFHLVCALDTVFPARGGGDSIGVPPHREKCE